MKLSADSFMGVTLNMTFCFSLCCPQNALFSFVFCHVNFNMSWYYLFWFIFLGFLCVFYTTLSSLRIGKLSAIILSNIFSTPLSILLLWPLLGYTGILYVISGFLKLFSIFLINLFAILTVWLSLFCLHKVPRWQRNMMRRQLLVQFSSVTQSYPNLCNPMNSSTPGLPVHHQLPEFTQTHVHRVSDAI